MIIHLAVHFTLTQPILLHRTHMNETQYLQNHCYFVLNAYFKTTHVYYWFSICTSTIQYCQQIAMWEMSKLDRILPAQNSTLATLLKSSSRGDWWPDNHVFGLWRKFFRKDHETSQNFSFAHPNLLWWLRRNQKIGRVEPVLVWSRTCAWSCPRSDQSQCGTSEKSILEKMHTYFG